MVISIGMGTTVAVDEGTHRLLAHLKESWGLDSYDAVIRKLAGEAAGVPDSMFGSSPGLRPLTRKSRLEAFGDERRTRERK
jgi:hypothetical protein